MGPFYMDKDLKNVIRRTETYLILSEIFDVFMILTIIIGH